MLAVLIRTAQGNVVDRAVFGWTSGWEVPLLDGTMDGISWFTDIGPRAESLDSHQ